MFNESKMPRRHETFDKTAHYLRKVPTLVRAALGDRDITESRLGSFCGPLDPHLNSVDSSAYSSRGPTVKADEEKLRMRSLSARVRQSTFNPSQSPAPLKTDNTTEERGKVGEDRSESDEAIIERFQLSNMSLVLMPITSGIIPRATVGSQQPRSSSQNERNGSGYNRNQVTCPPTPSAPTFTQHSATFNPDDPVAHDDEPSLRVPALRLHGYTSPALSASAVTGSFSNYSSKLFPTSECTPKLSDIAEVSDAVGQLPNSITIPHQGRSQAPHRPIGPSPASGNQANAECASLSLTRERITLTDTIHRRYGPSWLPVDNRVIICVPTPIPGQKKKWAIHHRRQVRQLERSSEELLIYSDGSLRFEQRIRSAGAGVVGFRQGTALFPSFFALGSNAHVYDAEMEGLAKGAEMVWQWMCTHGPAHGITRVWFFADSTDALQSIYWGTPGRVHNCTYRFRLAAHAILDAYPYIMINIEWVPAHYYIQGNEIADALAKQASAYYPIRLVHMFSMPAPTANRHEVRDTTESSSSNKSEESRSPVPTSLNANAAPDTMRYASQPVPASEWSPELPKTLEKPAVLSPPLSPAVRQYDVGQVWQELVGQSSDSIIISTGDARDDLSELRSEPDSTYDSESDAEHVFESESDF